MRQLILAALLILVAVPRPAWAGDAAAEALFRAGREAASKGDYTTACARFEESNRLESAVGTVFNLANCREKLGQIASAWQRYREVKDRLPAGDQRIAVAEARVEALEKRLPKLTLKLAPKATNAKVIRDGVELGPGSLGVAVPVDPGQHEIVVRARGHADRQVALEIREGEHQELLLEPGQPVPGADRTGPSPAASQPAVGITEERETEAGAPNRTLGFVIGGIGIAGLATSMVTGAMVLSKKSTVEKECDNKLCSPEGIQAGESGRTLSTVSTIAFAVGAAGIGLGAYLILSAGDGKEQARLEVRALPHAAAVTVGGQF
jgi:hypothetical protein